MLAFAVFGTKEIIVYVIVIILIILGVIWFMSRGRAKS
jgi:heme/copper-type cytochrome/quinol oxidase subunit 4